MNRQKKTREEHPKVIIELTPLDIARLAMWMKSKKRQHHPCAKPLGPK
ncbi:MAG: hypothetical protein WC712_15215 [Candidatus Brocadiia bacterium]